MLSFSRFLQNASLLLFLLVGRVSFAAVEIRYLVTPIPPTEGKSALTHLAVIVTGTVPEKTLQFQMAVWSPGDYHVMDHAKYVRSVKATNEKKETLSVQHPDANTWEVPADGTPITLEYDLPNTPPGYFSENVQVRDKYAFYNGPATYMYLVGHKDAPAVVTVALPSGWKATAVMPLEALPPASKTTMSFRAPDYDTLADSPLLCGECVTREFTVVGKPHTLAYFGAHTGTNYDDLIPVVQKIVTEENRLMGGPPYERYVIFLDVGGRGGGLEHLNSHRLAWFRGTPARFGAGGIAHEFFHLWNVKRIRPAVLGPFDYITPPRTKNLWFAEGVTSYYGDLSVCRAGLTNESEYLGGMAEKIQALQANPARLRVTAEQSSEKVWNGGFSQGYGGLSYYLKGELIGLCLDLKIRALTQNAKSLDDVMHILLARYGLPKPGYPEDGLRQATIETGGAEMGAFYDRLCRTTEEMPFDECLRFMGLRVQGSPAGRMTIEADPQATPETLARRKTWLKAP